MNLQELGNYKEQIYFLAAKYGVKEIKVFGSVASGKEDLHSDIDFLVEMEKGRTLLNRLGFKHELEDLLGKSVDVVSLYALKGRLKNNILDEAIPF